MKKTVSKLFALVMAVAVLLSMTLCVGAQENYSLKDVEQWKTEDYVDSSIENCAVSGGGAAVGADNGGADNFTAEDNAGVFLLKMEKGMDVKTIGAFLVEDNLENQYVLTHYTAIAYAKEGYKMTIMVPGGENIEAVCVGGDANYHIAYLYAPAITFYEPLKFTPEAFNTTISIGLGFADEAVSVAKRIEYKSFDFSEWIHLTVNGYGYKDREFTWNWLGAPVFPGTKEYKVQGIGTYAESQNGEKIVAVMNFKDMVLVNSLSLAAIENGSLSQGTDEEDPVPETTTPAPEPDPEPDPGPTPKIDKKVLFIGGIFVAAAAYYFYNNNKKDTGKKEESPAPVPMETTLPMDPMLPNDTTKPSHDVTRPMAVWQLRSMGGPLGDKNFPISGTTLIGRGSGADIRFPESTPGISGKHCEIVASADGVILRDVGSSYGTFVGQTRLSPNVDQPIYAGDTFTLAQNGPVFRLEKIGAFDGGSDGPAVRDVKGRNYRAGGNAKLTFGRKSGNKVQIEDNAVSSAHCVLYHEGGKLFLKDLESSNGTFFNEKERLRPNTPYRVRKGMSFYLSSPANTFVITEE